MLLDAGVDKNAPDTVRGGILYLFLVVPDRLPSVGRRLMWIDETSNESGR